mmetsp:Transcript_10049/g.28157  ORF Transcript_10049/g.28157 Transcript_10049/m.28157 type:complete len:219 (+) Transcript_10049:236-892(+)
MNPECTHANRFISDTSYFMYFPSINSPGGGGDVNRRSLAHELGKVVPTNPARSRATQTLHSRHHVHVDVLPVGKLEGQLRVPPITGNTGILLVDGRIVEHPPFGFLHGGQHPWLAARIAIGADADIDLLGIRAGFERFGNAQDGIGSAHGDGRQVLAGGTDGRFGSGVGGEGGGGGHGCYEAQDKGRDLELHWLTKRKGRAGQYALTGTTKGFDAVEE